MQGKIALEEHFAIDTTLSDSQVFGAHVWDTLRPRLLDIQDIRLREMDKHGVEMMILAQRAGRAGDPRRHARHRGRS